MDSVVFRWRGRAMRAYRSGWRLLAYAWAAPYSLVGLAFGGLGLLFGAGVQWRDGALEFSGGRLGARIARLAAPFCFSAITLGHAILAVDRASLAAARAHEHVHVRQYERWGILFVPAYLLSSLAQLMRGRRPYLDNPFEREAYSRAPVRPPLPPRPQRR
jgi:hypothetical protein